jgi:hypothetical protein
MLFYVLLLQQGWNSLKKITVYFEKLIFMILRTCAMNLFVELNCSSMKNSFSKKKKHLIEAIKVKLQEDPPLNFISTLPVV